MPSTVELAVGHIDALIELAGLDKSESATEKFVELLGAAVSTAQYAIVESHAEGLCLDCRSIIAETLTKNRETIQ